MTTTFQNENCPKDTPDNSHFIDMGDCAPNETHNIDHSTQVKPHKEPSINTNSSNLSSDDSTADEILQVSFPLFFQNRTHIITSYCVDFIVLNNTSTIELILKPGTTRQLI